MLLLCVLLTMEATTRFCVSVEQMVPYLENLCNGDRERDQDDDDNDEEEPYDENDQSSQPPDIPENLSDEAPVNYIDLSELNPIVEAYNCLQIDELIEGISEIDFIEMGSIVSFFYYSFHVVFCPIIDSCLVGILCVKFTIYDVQRVLVDIFHLYTTYYVF